ncbi:hypothetical protein B5X24_HaOG208224 [Helicoverpa armigera]|uniref:Uncharacterized protein n=1 Tax=Helicoverpa armigera TaxID=29058 RepID=A0A2W1BGF4_HELAM|nr:hypothetical protein B5X24_HaOG208224 [Helicoverpa armigera]
MEYPWSPYLRTTGPVTFGGHVKGRGTVSLAGRFGNDGYNQITSYSELPSPICAPPLPTFSTHTTLPAITKLPAVILPTTFNVPATNNMPSTLSVPETPMPFIMATATVPYSSESNSFESVLPLPSTVKFSGKVPASGRVRICKHFC